jgi:hypothetical protein
MCVLCRNLWFDCRLNLEVNIELSFNYRSTFFLFKSHRFREGQSLRVLIITFIKLTGRKEVRAKAETNFDTLWLENIQSKAELVMCKLSILRVMDPEFAPAVT